MLLWLQYGFHQKNAVVSKSADLLHLVDVKQKNIQKRQPVISFVV